MKILKTILAALVLAITASSCHKDGEQADATSPLKDSPVVAQQVITLNGDTIIVCDLSLLKDTIDFFLQAASCSPNNRQIYPIVSAFRHFFF